MKRVVLTISILVFAIFAAWAYKTHWSLDHMPHQAIWSPSGRHVATEILGGEGIRPPYGTQVVIHNASNPMGIFSAGPVFSGLCKELSFRWESDNELLLNCSEASHVETQVEQHGPVHVTFNISVSTRQVVAADAATKRPRR